MLKGIIRHIFILVCSTMSLEAGNLTITVMKDNNELGKVVQDSQYFTPFLYKVISKHKDIPRNFSCLYIPEEKSRLPKFLTENIRLEHFFDKTEGNVTVWVYATVAGALLDKKLTFINSFDQLSKSLPHVKTFKQWYKIASSIQNVDRSVLTGLSKDTSLEWFEQSFTQFFTTFSSLFTPALNLIFEAANDAYWWVQEGNDAFRSTTVANKTFVAFLHLWGIALAYLPKSEQLTELQSKIRNDLYTRLEDSFQYLQTNQTQFSNLIRIPLQVTIKPEAPESLLSLIKEWEDLQVQQRIIQAILENKTQLFQLLPPAKRPTSPDELLLVKELKNQSRILRVKTVPWKGIGAAVGVTVLALFANWARKTEWWKRIRYERLGWYVPLTPQREEQERRLLIDLQQRLKQADIKEDEFKARSYEILRKYSPENRKKLERFIMDLGK